MLFMQKFKKELSWIAIAFATIASMATKAIAQEEYRKSLIEENDINQFIHKFRCQTDQERFSCRGLIKTECKEHLKFDWIAPQAGGGSKSYGLHIELSDKNLCHFGKDELCSKTAQNCIQVTKTFTYTQSVPDGVKLVGRDEDNEESVDDDVPTKLYKSYEFPKSFLVGETSFETKQAKEERERLAFEKEIFERINSACEGTMAGKVEDAEWLYQNIGRDLPNNLKEIVDRVLLEPYKEKIANAASLEELNEFIDQISEFIKNDSLSPKSKQFAAQLLKKIKDRALVLNGTNEAPTSEAAKWQIAERAMQQATGWDQNLEYEYQKTQLAHILAAARSGNDEFYQSVMGDGNRVLQALERASQMYSQTGNKNFLGLANAYAAYLRPHPTTISIPGGYTSQYILLPVTGIDRLFIESQRRKTQVISITGLMNQIQGGGGIGVDSELSNLLKGPTN